MSESETAGGERPPAFETTYNCNNCGQQWSEEHPSRTIVEKSSAQQSVIVKNKDCDEFITSDCGCCYYVQCPVCELLEGVVISDRAPVETADYSDTESSQKGGFREVQQ